MEISNKPFFPYELGVKEEARFALLVLSQEEMMFSGLTQKLLITCVKYVLEEHGTQIWGTVWTTAVFLSHRDAAKERKCNKRLYKNKFL